VEAAADGHCLYYSGPGGHLSLLARELQQHRKSHTAAQMFFSEQPGAQTVPFASEEMSVRACKGDMQEAEHQI